MLEPQLRYDLESPTAAEETLRAAIETGGKLRDPSLIDALYRRGRVRRELHKYHEALIDFRTALDGMAIFLKGDYVPPPYLHRANIYLETARIHTLTGEIQLAQHTLRLAIEEANKEQHYPNWADIHLEQARISIAHRQFEEAEAQLALALEKVSESALDAGTASIHLELGVIKGHAGEYEASLFCLHEALAANPAGELRIRVQVALGDVLWLQGLPASAIWRYHQVRQDLESRVAAGASHLSELLAGIVDRIERGRGDRHKLYNDLLDQTNECLVTWDARGLVRHAREIAHLAAAFDEYQRARALVLGLESHGAIAALAHHMMDLSDPVEVDTSTYEHDFALYTQQLTEWEQELVELYLD